MTEDGRSRLVGGLGAGVGGLLSGPLGGLLGRSGLLSRALVGGACGLLGSLVVEWGLDRARRVPKLPR